MKKVIKFFRWFYPGLKLKRWFTLEFIGLFLIAFSSAWLLLYQTLFWKIIYGALFLVGFILFVLGRRSALRSVLEVIYPDKDRKEIIDLIYEKRFLSRGPRIVAIGGGTGLSTILEGLKEYTANLTAVVTVADEGGSSGRLRQEFGILPPGDIRNCLVSLAEAPQLMRDLFQYRFLRSNSSGSELNGIKGHSFGNLFITALVEVTGSFKDAIEESSKVLAIRGRVLPSSLERVRIQAEYSDGTIQKGEDKIPLKEKAIKKISLIPPTAKANPEALEAIRKADLIIIGPGSLFTSIIPNLLITSLSEEIAKRNVLKIYICNVMTQHGETDGYTASDHIEMLISHSQPQIINACLVNSGRLEYKLLPRYAKENSFPVILDYERIKKIGVEVFEGDVVLRSDYLRHDSINTARIVMQIYQKFKKRR